MPISRVFDARLGGDGCRKGCVEGGMGARVTQLLRRIAVEQRHLLIYGAMNEDEVIYYWMNTVIPLFP